MKGTNYRPTSSKGHQPRERGTRKERQRERLRGEVMANEMGKLLQAETRLMETLAQASESITDEALFEQLRHESEKFDALSDAYTQLRKELIAAHVKLHRAHTIVSSAALRHRDEKLAACARDYLHGMNKLDAEVKTPRVGDVLKAVGL